MIVIPQASSMATSTFVILASILEAKLPLRKSLRALEQLSILSEYLDSSDVCCTLFKCIKNPRPSPKEH